MRYLVTALLFSASSATDTCDHFSNTFFELSCCPDDNGGIVSDTDACNARRRGYQGCRCCDTPAVSTSDTCWFQRAAFPPTLGDAAPYVHNGNLLKNDPNAILYSFVQGTALNAANPSTTLEQGLRISFSLDASADIVYNDFQILDLVLQDLDNVDADAAASVVQEGTYVLISPADGYAYRTSTPVAKSFKDYFHNVQWFDPVDGSAYVFYKCSDHDTLFPTHGADTGNVGARTVATKRTAQELNALVDPRISFAALPVAAVPDGSSLTPGQTVTIHDVCTKRFCYIEYHACWCPTCLAAGGIGPWAMSGESGPAPYLSQFFVDQSIDDVSEVLMHSNVPFGQAVDAQIALDPSVADNRTHFMTNVLELTQGTAEDFNGLVSLETDVCKTLGLEVMALYYGDPTLSTVQSLIGPSAATNATLYHRLTGGRKTVLDAGIYMGPTFPAGMNTQHIILDMATNKTVLPKQTIFALGAHWIKPYAQHRFFAALNRNDKLAEWQVTTRPPSSPAVQFVRMADDTADLLVSFHIA